MTRLRPDSATTSLLSSPKPRPQDCPLSCGRAGSTTSSSKAWPRSNPAARSSALRRPCASCPTARTSSNPTAAGTTLDSIRPGEVVVIEARGESGSGTLGDILALRAKSLGATGVITDGGVRDSAEVAGILPVFATANNPAVLGRRHVPWESDVAVACGNATVLPGDVIVADDDGAIVIPRDLAEEVVDAALAKEIEDGWVAEQVGAGNPIEGLFPPKGEWKAKFDEWKASR